MKTWFRFAALSWIATLLAAPVAVYAQGESASNPAPVGTWLLTVSFAGGNPPPFKEILTLHHGGTVTETNGSLNSASGLLPPPFNLIGSDGQGTWQRMPGSPVIGFGPAASTGVRLHRSGGRRHARSCHPALARGYTEADERHRPASNR